MRGRQLALAFEGGNADSIPLVYVACRLTGLNHEQRKLLDSWCTHVEQTVTETADESENRWEVAVHVPFNWSGPWADNRDPDAIYKSNSQIVNSCAAVIILCIDGGGLGVGQEFAWATALRVPILLLHPQDQPPSRQALGTPADLTVVAFESAIELTEAVRAFLRANRSVIEDWHRRTQSLTVALAPLRELLADAWHALSAGGRDRVQAESRMDQRRIDQLIDDDTSLASASLSEVYALVGTLGIDPTHLLAGPTLPDLTSYQREALGTAADEYEWRGSDVLALETRARLELARGGMRRLSLSTPADWVQLRQQLDPDV